MSINTENAKKIRKPMEVYCGIVAQMQGAEYPADFSASDDKLIDADYETTLANTDWPARHIVDFQGNGTPLDGSYTWYDASEVPSINNGKIGVRGHVDTPLVFTISNTAVGSVPAVSIAGSNIDRIEYDGESYSGSAVIIPLVSGDYTKTATVYPVSGFRAEISDLIPGIIANFDNSNLISCTVAMRGDLTDSPSWQISDIEIKAYMPQNLESIIPNMADDSPIWYYAGYDGDYCEIRRFYLAEPASQNGNIVTMKGEDASARLDDYSQQLQIVATPRKAARQTVYNKFKQLIESAGVNLRESEQPPAVSGSNTEERIIVMQEATARDHVANIMNLGHYGTFWPQFTDAGVPKVTWSKPTQKWVINESDIGDHVQTYARKTARITSDDENGVTSAVTKSDVWETITEPFDVTANQKVIQNYSDMFWAYSVANEKTRMWSTANSVAYVVNRATVENSNGTKSYQSYVQGKRVTVTPTETNLQNPGGNIGGVLKLQNIVHGQMQDGSAFFFPRPSIIFDRQPVCGSFRFKGDPRWMPRDVFKMRMLDGSEHVCMVENVTMVHEGGGTYADVTYRQGVI